MPGNCGGRVRFGTFEADLSAGELRKSGRRVRLQEQPFRVLKLFLERPGEVVTREELRKEIWADDVYVDFERSLNVAVARLREALGDSPHRPAYIETVPRRGYRFIARLEPNSLQDSVVHGSSVPGPGRYHWASWRLAAGVAGIGAVAAIILPWYGRSPAPAVEPTLAAEPLTYYEGVEDEASFSPDGNQVTFTWNGPNQDNFDVYVNTIGGARALRLTEHPNRDFSPAWSPDGRWIAFLRQRGDGRSDLYRISPLGGREELLFDVSAPPPRLGGTLSIHDRYLCWSRDSEFLAVVEQASAGEAPSLFLYSSKSGSKYRLTHAPKRSFGDRNPAFSPDGRRLAFNGSRGEKIGVFILQLGGDLAPAGDPEFLVRQHRPARGLSWMPDGRELLVLTEGHFWKVAMNHPRSMRQLDFAGGMADLPAVSQTANRLVFTQPVFEVNIWRIGLSADLAGADPAKVISSTGYDVNFAYSPVGEQVVFKSNRAGREFLWISDADGTDPAPLVTREGGTPRWSPDGSSIAFDSPSEQRDYDIWTISPKGGVARPLTQGTADDRTPNWSRDGNWIYFASDRGGGHQLWKRKVNSGEEIQVTRNGGFYAEESIDGQFVYYTKALSDWSVWRVPARGGREVQILDPVSTWNNFAVGKRGIFYTPQRGPDGKSPILFYDFSDESIKLVFEPERPTSNGLSIAPDGQNLLYSQIDREGSDLMLVEDFR